MITACQIVFDSSEAEISEPWMLFVFGSPKGNDDEELRWLDAVSHVRELIRPLGN